MADKSELKKQMLFSDLTDAELGIDGARRSRSRSYPKGKPIFKEGEPTKGIYLVKSGKVEISKITADGWKQTLAILTENHIFGELVGDRGKQRCTARCNGHRRHGGLPAQDR